MTLRTACRGGLAIFAVLIGTTSACGGADEGESSATTVEAAPATSTPTLATTTVPPTDCTPALTVDPTAEHEFTYDSVERAYLLSLPEGDDGTVALPLILNFHGHGGTKEQTETNTEVGARGAEAGFIVVTPDAEGEPQAWNMFGAPDQADDFGYVPALVADLQEQLCIDPDRIYAAGHSNGSAFAGFLTCRSSEIFAAVAMVSATTPAGCPEGVARSVLAIAGTADPQVPYDGGTISGSANRIPPVLDVIAAYVARYECGEPPTEEERIPGVTRTRYSGCIQDAEVVLDTVEGGDHSWPGSATAELRPENSEAGRSYDATGAVLDFFAAHELPAG